MMRQVSGRRFVELRFEIPGKKRGVGETDFTANLGNGARSRFQQLDGEVETQRTNEMQRGLTG